MPVFNVFADGNLSNIDNILNSQETLPTNFDAESSILITLVILKIQYLSTLINSTKM